MKLHILPKGVKMRDFCVIVATCLTLPSTLSRMEVRAEEYSTLNGEIRHLSPNLVR